MSDIFDQLWARYIEVNPKVHDIRNFFIGEGESVFNDHIALRTFDDPRVNIEVLAQVFKKMGYIEKKSYHFSDKKLKANHYEHKDAFRPKVFISELELSAFSKRLQSIVDDCLKSVTATLTNRDDFVNSGRPWSTISFDTYEFLRSESEYAAWMYAWGYMANHFTIKVNHLKKFPSISAVNTFLESKGVLLNSAGGKIKGSPRVFLEQSSTMANKQFVQFTEGKKEIPSCYYEFAFRHKLANGDEFPDFIADNADKIFESTNMH
jgi:hypothetical protein